MDRALIAKALAYAIVTIDNLPPPLQEGSDKDAMLKLLMELVDGTATAYLLRCAADNITAKEDMIREINQAVGAAKARLLGWDPQQWHDPVN